MAYLVRCPQFRTLPVSPSPINPSSPPWLSPSLFQNILYDMYERKENEKINLLNDYELQFQNNK